MSQIHDLKEKLRIQKQIDYLLQRVNRYAVKYHNPWAIALHMAYAALGSVSMGINAGKKLKKTSLCIGIIIEGGLGDLLIGLNWLCYLHEQYLKNTPFNLETGFNSKMMLNCFAPSFIQGKYTQKEMRTHIYDVEIRITRVPQVIKIDLDRVNKLNPNLLVPLMKYIELSEIYSYYIIQSIYRDSISHNLPTLNPKRWLQPDVVGLFNIQEKFILPIAIQTERETLRGFGLEHQKYITINREVGYERVTESTKLWPLSYYRGLVEKLKQQYSRYKILEIGTGKGERIGNTHLNLAGKTSLEEVKVILKNAALHIDSEGGLVHLRHALLGGPSLVFFGPSDPAVLGYSENLNLRSTTCPICCENVCNTWQEGCVLNNHVCMQSLTVQNVLKALNSSGVLK